MAAAKIVPIGGVLGFFKILFTSPFKILIYLFTSRLLLTGTVSIIFFFLIMASAVQESIKQQKLSIFFIEAGATFANPDSRVKEEVNKLLSTETTESRLFIWLRLASGLWFIIFMISMWTKLTHIVFGHGVSPLLQFFLVLFWVSMLQIIYHLATVNEFYTPFSGVAHLFSNLLNIVDFSVLRQKLERFRFAKLIEGIA